MLLTTIDFADLLDKFWHFVMVGGIGFGADLALTYGLLLTKKVKKYWANSAGFLLGVSINYMINRQWTFHSQDPNIAAQYLKFVIIGIIGLALVNGIIHFLHTKHGKAFLPSKIFAMFIFMFWNFGANYFYTFA